MRRSADDRGKSPPAGRRGMVSLAGISRALCRCVSRLCPRLDLRVHAACAAGGTGAAGGGRGPSPADPASTQLTWVFFQEIHRCFPVRLSILLPHERHPFRAVRLWRHPWAGEQPQALAPWPHRIGQPCHAYCRRLQHRHGIVVPGEWQLARERGIFSGEWPARPVLCCLARHAGGGLGPDQMEHARHPAGGIRQQGVRRRRRGAVRR